MADQRQGGIAWTDETWNVIRGCSDVNLDCIHCYAKRIAAFRLSQPGQPYHGLAEVRNDKAYWTGEVNLVDDLLLQPLRWKRPRKIFVNAMSDLFHPGLTWVQIDKVVAVMALAHWHTFQVLTKRPDRMLNYFDRIHGHEYRHDMIQHVMDLTDEARIPFTLNHPNAVPYTWPLSNVWWGASMGHQKAADTLLPYLLRCRPNALVLWVSAEPLWERMTLHPPATLGQRILSRFYNKTEFDPAGKQPEVTRDWTRWPNIDWLVAGGESGTGPDIRPMHPDWPRELQAECQANGVAFQFKQWGEWLPVSYLEPNTQTPMLNISCDGKTERIVAAGPDRSQDINMRRVGKKAAGRLLDGKEWNQWPIQATNFERIT